jgi:hypothetical protein
LPMCHQKTLLMPICGFEIKLTLHQWFSSFAQWIKIGLNILQSMWKIQ